MKINYHNTNGPILSTHFRRRDQWIGTLGHEFQYGTNDNVSDVENLTNPHGDDMNVTGLFPGSERWKHSHEQHSYTGSSINYVRVRSISYSLKNSLCCTLCLTYVNSKRHN